jgi:hypothetical protein
MNNTHKPQLLDLNDDQNAASAAASHTHVNVPKVEDELTALEIEELEETSGGIMDPEPGMTPEDAEDAVGLAPSAEVPANLNNENEEEWKEESIS